MYALFTSAEWWVVYVRSENEPRGSVYGGQPGSVARWVREHASWAGPIVEMDAQPFASGPESLVARVAMEDAVYAKTAA